ncbi:MAG: hypothetical protein ACI9MC_001014 [Kiritimatiellia bacterium]|jgi:uncharacterized protein (TIGR01777 family)
MQEFVKLSTMPVAPTELFAWHERPGAFARLAPPWERMRIVDGDSGLHDGTRTVFDVRKAGVWVRWVAEHRNYQQGVSFTDVQRKGPFAHWEHRHTCIPGEEEGTSNLEDRIQWTPVGGSLGAMAVPLVEQTLHAMFRFRHRRTRDDLLRHRRYAARPRLRIAVTGATGLVGQELCAFLTTGGHHVVRVVRKDPRDGDALWDLKRETIDASALEGVDAVVHLAGASVSKSWTTAQKRAILDSRVQGTRLLCRALSRLERKPKVLISASAVGFYGGRGDEVLTEDSKSGRGFLSEVCQDWEAQTAVARDAGIRVVNLRIGLVTTPKGAALAKLLPAFRAGTGGPIGSGRQWMPWIALDDLVGAVYHCMFEESIQGPVNAVGPNPVMQRRFAEVLGGVLNRPALMPLPAFMVRTLFGEMGKRLLLEGQRAAPTRLLDSGFEFLHPELGDLLRYQLGVG